MKQVFNNRQLAHVWAQQTQATGRNPSNSMYFSGNKIYSYGSHYCVASINVNSNGDRLNLVNECNYSVTTAKQRSDVWNALNYKGLYVPCPEDTYNYKNEAYLFDKLIKTIDVSLNPNRKYSGHEDYKRSLKNLNTYLTFIGKKEVSVPMNIVEMLIDVHAVRSIRLNELKLKNEEKNRIKAYNEAMARKQRIIEYKEELELWPKGLNTKSIPSDLFPKDFDVIRIKPSNPKVVETSRGAEVPLDHALRLLRLTLAKETKQGERVGHFTVDNIKDDTLKVGCHTISIKQASEVLKPLLDKVG